MTVSTLQSIGTFLGNGSTSVFNFSFNNSVPVNSGTPLANFILLYTNASGQQSVLPQSVYNLNFTSAFTGTLWGIGGTLTYPLAGSPIASGTSLTLQRTFSFQQLVSISNQGDFSSENIEAMGDILEMQIQQVSARGGAYRGIWASGVVYNFGDIVQDGANGDFTNNLYVCAIANTSGVWNTDLANGDWVLTFNTQALINIVGTYLPLGGGTITGNLAVLGTTTLSNAGPSLVTATGAATARTLASYFADVINVKDFGAKGDGVTDDTAALQAAITAAGNSTIRFPAGNYIKSAALTVATGFAPLLIGDGIGSTRIINNSSTAGGIIFSNATSASMPLGGGIQNMTIDGGVSPTIAGSSGTGVAIECANDGFTLSNLLIRGWGNGITSDQCFNSFTTNVTVLYNTFNAIIIGTRSGYSAGGGNTFSDINLSNFGSLLGGTPTGIQIVQSGGEFWDNIDITSYSTGVHIAPKASGQVSYQFFSSVLADTCTSLGWFIDASNSGSSIVSTMCTNCWSGFNAGNGIEIQGAGVDDFRWVAGRIRENVNHGVEILSGNRIAIQNSSIAANGRTTMAGTYNGINIAAGVSGFQITDNTIGNFASSSMAQGTGIYITAGTSNNVVIADNLSIAPAGGGVAISNNSTGTNVQISDNPGYNPVGVLGPPSFPSTTVPYTNAYGVTCRVFIHGGAITAIAINGTATGLITGSFDVANGETITITYSGSPAWTWFGL